MPASISAVLTVTGFFTLAILGYRGAVWLSRQLLLARFAGGCRTCYWLGQIPLGPPYWLLRVHLRRAAPLTDAGDRELR